MGLWTIPVVHCHPLRIVTIGDHNHYGVTNWHHIEITKKDSGASTSNLADESNWLLDQHCEWTTTIMVTATAILANFYIKDASTAMMFKLIFK